VDLASAAEAAGLYGVELARDVAAAVNQGEDCYEQAEGRYEQDQNSVAERRAALRAGSSRALVTHGATLRENVRDGQRNQSRAASR
jgi:hypothetical protein